VSKIDKLIVSYKKHICVPWNVDAAAAQRVIFCIYDETDELRFRAKIEEFAIETRNAKHDWFVYDLTDTFAAWLASQKYAKSYFKKPNLIDTILPKYLDYIEKEFDNFLTSIEVNNNAVIALKGVGSLFGFMKIKDLVDRLAPKVAGRLLIFFPGSYENNNYRLLDAYDGWNYLAIPITANQEI